MTHVIQFRHPNNNIRFTKQLFWENWVGISIENRTVDPVFSLYSDKPGMINFGREYIELEDISGYKISMKYFGEYEQWNALMKCSWFREAKAQWDREIEAKLYTVAMDKLVALAASEGPQAIQAAKFLATKQYREKQLKGRPSKDQIEGHLKQEAREQQSFADDAARIFKIVK